jgi:hypothetical protein
VIRAFINKFPRTVVKDPELRQVQDNVARCFDDITGKEILNGQLLEGIQLTAGLNYIDHKLGRQVRGYRIVRLSANVSAPMWDVDNKIIINAAAPVAVSIWVF